MSYILEIIELILTIAVFIVIMIVKKSIGSVDTYFNEKAKNLATKQDIKNITEITEKVQHEYKKQLDLFEADIEFKYKFHEEQYTNLYSVLYSYISESEAIKQLNRELNIDSHFENLPIAEFQDDEEESNFTKMLILIKEKKQYASPSLIDLVNAIEMLEGKTQFFQNDTSKFENLSVKIKTLIVQTILEDYNWLRKELQLPKKKNVLQNIGQIDNPETNTD